jgi:alkylation response protein AidB-like acyl-CoA dehydrogenase
MVQTAAVDTEKLAESLRPAIETHRDEAEALRRLPDALVDELRRAGAFNLTTPRERGGRELSLLDVLDVYEAFGRIDGSVAWTVWNGNLGFAAAMLAEPAADAIWSGTDDPIIANSARPVGRAEPAGAGYVLSGRWDIVSAVDAADWVALFGFVMDGGQPRLTPAGPDIRVFFLPRGHYEILDTWHTSGMRGTGSNTVVVDGAFVTEAMAISPFAPARIDRPLYRVPAFTIASSGSAPIVVGIAQAAIDEVVALAPTKATDNGQVLLDRPHAASRLGGAQTSLDAARALLRHAAAAIDDAAGAGRPVDEAVRARMRAAMSHAAAVSRDVLTTCRELASSTAVYLGQPIERLIRDGEVATQHAILARTHLDIRGRLMLGLDAGVPVV